MVDGASQPARSFLKFVVRSTPSALGTVALCGFLQVLPAGALEFGSGAFQGNLDITISHGVTLRFAKQNDAMTKGKNNANRNDGNLNYNRGLVSNTSKFTADIDVETNRFGVFFRTTGFLDFENQNSARERTPLSAKAKNAAVRNFELLDAYVTSAFDVDDVAVDLRLGKHVLNWGESTFIPNGINAFNPFDVSKLRLPGSEIREALIPVNMISASVAPSYKLSLEGFYQLDWEKTKIDPVGSFFSTTDYAGPGASKAFITEIIDSDQGRDFGSQFATAINADIAVFNSSSGKSLPSQLAFDPNFGTVQRGPDVVPSKSGQWGIAMRYLAEELGQTELGFYLVNYHSRLPFVNATTADPPELVAAVDAASAILGGSSTQTAVAADPKNEGDPEKIGEALGGVAAALAIDRYANSAQYSLEYPEDIQLLGLSFNAVLGASGWALQGEYSYRRDVPLQRAEREIFKESLNPVTKAVKILTSQDEYEGQTDNERDTALGDHLGSYAPFRLNSYVRRNVSQIQATATKVLGPIMGADSSVVAVEAAMMHVHNMPDEPLESPAGGVLSAEEADADATSWGYRVAARLDYNNALGPINLFPYTQFQHDVNGNSPAPSGPFVEGRTTLTLGLGADYLSSWQGDLSYTRFAGKGNSLSDRDFISASVKYSF